MLMNVDPLNPAGAPSAEELLQCGARGARLVSRFDIEDYVMALQDAGLMVLAVVTEESAGYLCPADVYQINNEPDINGMPAATYVAYWRLYRDTYPDVPMIGAGLASGNPSYWQQVQYAGGLHGASGFAVHPYAKTATQAKTLLAAYQKITPSLPLWVSEWNRPQDEILGFAAMLRQTAVMSAWFCWSDGMVDGFGLSPSAGRVWGAAA